jgi:hypothetical protein
VGEILLHAAAVVQDDDFGDAPRSQERSRRKVLREHHPSIVVAAWIRRHSGPHAIGVDEERRRSVWRECEVVKGHRAARESLDEFGHIHQRRWTRAGVVQRDGTIPATRHRDPGLNRLDAWQIHHECRAAPLRQPEILVWLKPRAQRR